MTAPRDDVEPVSVRPIGTGSGAWPGLRMVVQPIVDLATGALVAAEALATSADPAGPPITEVFDQARAAGRGFELEAACIRAARLLPSAIHCTVPLAVNVSPDALEDDEVQAALAGDLTGFIVELTEQPASDPVRLDRRVLELRERGAQIAIDDVTTGYAGLIRMAELRPDVVKLDRALVDGIRSSAAQITVVEALVLVARRLDARVIAEGVETLSDLVTLSALGVNYVQGWAVGLPAAELTPVTDEVARACRDARRELLSVGPSGSFPAGSESARVEAMFHTTAAIVRDTQYGAGRHTMDDAVDLSAALDLVRAASGTSAAVAYLLTVDGGLRAVGTSGDFGALLRPRLDEAVAAAAMAGVMFESYASDPDLAPAERDLLAARGMSSGLVVPLCFDGTLVGVLEVMQRRPRRWTARVILHLRGLAENFGVALAGLQR
jgi:EAL domain-containing protein (putative c-di-GMP-specific phosphodiesterase class I)